ncbi:hypothetical protein Anas_04454 [Armadillidium nasatum]|uniref:Uncharacterized protein n=1 Tax=Armadillidium nasatum TaxID=96803 RepID=A0A5N5T180_9CRUS|nr:hypothetical protein Anas_04454 [Armadillidium nasatum]
MDTATVSVVNPSVLDGASVSAVEWGLIGRRLLSVMSGGETPSRPWIESQTPVSSPITYGKISEETESSGGGEDGRERRKLKNEDSSYDSDFEPCETSTSPRGEVAHEDVSRTTSETLGAEFEDYVTHTPLHIAARPTFTAQTSVSSNIGTSCSTSSNVRTTTGHHVPLSAPSLTVTEATPDPCGTSLPVFPFVPTTISSTSPSVIVSKTDGTTNVSHNCRISNDNNVNNVSRG